MPSIAASNQGRSIPGQIIATHDTGLWDREDYLKVGSRLAHKVPAREAVAMAQRHPGAELLVRTSGNPALNHHFDEVQRNPYEDYDVYSLSVVDHRGKVVPSKTMAIAEVLSAVSFKSGVSNLFEDSQTGIVPAGLTLNSSDDKLADIKWQGGRILPEHIYTLAPSRAALGLVSVCLPTHP